MDISGEYYCSRCMIRLETDDSGVCPHCGYDHARPARSIDQLEEGTMLANRYQLGAVLGCGGFGITYAAWDETLMTPVAVKEFFPRDFATRDTRSTCDISTDEKHHTEYNLGLRRFIEESRVLAMFHNVPGVVNVSDCFEENGTFYIVMEYVHGVTLDVWVRENKPDAKTLLTMFRGPIDALDAIHRQGVQHRDIKPSNMLVESSGTIKLIDFGSARLQTHQGKSIVLTEKYAPVEQYDLKQQQGPWTDVYSLCATIYEMLTGAELQTSISRQHHDEMAAPSALGVKLKPYQQRALMAGLAIEPGKRIRSMDELRSLLYNLPLPEEVVRRKAFRRRLAVTAACTALAAAGAAFNFSHGFTLSESVRYALYPDGFHLIANDHVTGELAVPASYAMIPVSAVHNDSLRGSGITSLTIPGSVSSIGDMAFNGCENLQIVTIGEGVTSIGAYAFANCPNLHTVILPDSITDIAANAFDGAQDHLMLWGSHGSGAEQCADAQHLAFACKNDYSYEYDADYAHGSQPPMTFGMTEAALGDHDTAVRQWSAVTADSLPAGVRITAYHGGGTDVIMPSYIDGIPVTHISCDDMSSFFPDGITSVVLPEHLITLPEGLLTDKSSLTDITLGGGLRIIEDYAFSNTNAAEIHLPQGVQYIGAHAFERTDIQALDLPDTLAFIGDEAFSNSAIVSIVIPDSVTSFGQSVFADCSALTSVVMPGGLTLLPDNTFLRCTRLSSIQLPDALQEIGSHCFQECRSLEALILPEGVHTVNAYAFESCTNLHLLSMTGRIQNIDSTSFYGCADQLIIHGPGDSSAREIAKQFSLTFVEMPSETGFRYEVDHGAIRLLQATGDITLPTYYRDEDGQYVIVDTITVGETVDASVITTPLMLKSIGDAAFANSSRLTTVHMHSAEVIGYGAFSNCRNLSQAALPDNLRVIEPNAFAHCSSLTSLDLPESLETIGEYAFNGCTQITSVSLPSGIITLPDACFAQTGLTEITIPRNVTYCGTAFFGCTSLTSVTFEQSTNAADGVKALHSTFYGCTSLQKVILPESLRSISPTTFQGCTSLTEVWIYSRDLRFDETYDTRIYLDTYYVNDDSYYFTAADHADDSSDSDAAAQTDQTRRANQEAVFDEGTHADAESMPFVEESSSDPVSPQSSGEDLMIDDTPAEADSASADVLASSDDADASEEAVSAAEAAGDSSASSRNAAHDDRGGHADNFSPNEDNTPDLSAVITDSAASNSTHQSSKDIGKDSIFITSGIFIRSGTDIENSGSSNGFLFDACPNVTVYCYPGSTAEAYCREHNIHYEYIPESIV